MSDSWPRAALRAHWRSLRVLLWAVTLGAGAIGLAFLPLFNVLGFEFAFVMALLGSLAGADLGSAFVRRVRATPSPALERAIAPTRMLGSVFGHAAIVNLGLLAIPLLIITLNGLRVRNCDWGFGIEAYVYLSVVSALLATAVGVLVQVAVGERRKLGNALPYAILIAAFLMAVWRFYAAPPVFSYNMFGGYFPGSIYDESIAFRAPFYWSRLFQLALIGTLFCACAVLLDTPRLTLGLRSRRPGGLRYRAALAGIACGWLAIHLWSSSGELRFEIDADDIREILGGRHETDNFVIYYPPGGDIERDIEIIAEDHEYRYAQLVRTFGVEPSVKITSFYFDSPGQKFELMGAKNVYVAKPWRQEIYVHHYGFPHRVLRHEIAHVVAGEFGDGMFNVSVDWVTVVPLFNVGLIEGTAVAADWPGHRSNLTPHQAVKAMRELGIAPPVEQILSTGFLTLSSARSYTLAGSFVRYLLDRYGAERLRVLYRTGGDFMTAYGAGRTVIANDWSDMIAATELPAEAAEVVRERFRRPGIFKRPCPHAIARRLGQAGRELRRGRLRDAISTVRSVCGDAPHEPRYRMELARLLTRAGDVDDAAEIYTALAGNAKEMSSTIRAQALLELATAAVRRGEHGEAESILRRAAELPLDDDTRRNVAARMFSVRHGGAAGPALRAYFWGDDPVGGHDAVAMAGRAAEAIAREPHNGLGYYLLGRNLRGRGAPREAANMLSTALDLELPHALLVREAARMLAAAAYLAGDDPLVRRAAKILMAADQPEVIRLEGADWLERIYWRANGELPAAR